CLLHLCRVRGGVGNPVQLYGGELCIAQVLKNVLAHARSDQIGGQFREALASLSRAVSKLADGGQINAGITEQGENKDEREDNTSLGNELFHLRNSSLLKLYINFDG